MFKIIFSWHNKIWGATKMWGGTATKRLPWLRACTGLRLSKIQAAVSRDRWFLNPISSYCPRTGMLVLSVFEVLCLLLYFCCFTKKDNLPPFIKNCFLYVEGKLFTTLSTKFLSHCLNFFWERLWQWHVVHKRRIWGCREEL